MKSLFSLLLLLAAAPFLVAEEPAMASLNSEDALELLAHELSLHYNLKGDWELDFVREIPLPEGTDDVRLAQTPSRPASSMVMRVRFLGAGVELYEGNIAFRAQLWGDVWVSQEPLTRGLGVDPYHLATQRVDLLRESGAVPVDALAEGEFIYYRSLPAGRVLHWRDLVRRPVVQRGQLIEVAAVDGALSVTLKGLALEDGAVGELIRIRNPESRREIAALVVSEGRAEIRF